MKIFIGADHVGFEMKQKLIPFLEALGYDVVDKGAKELNPADDYPDFVFPVAEAVAGDSNSKGVVIGSSGQGEGIAANRIKGVRALVYYGSAEPIPGSSKVGEPKSMIQVSREDNDSNIISLGASFLSIDDAKQAVQHWLEATFSGEKRHERRIRKLDGYND